MSGSARVAVVTGASRGIGAGLATELAARGAQVILVARSRADIEARAAELGGRAYPADLSDPATIETMLAEGADRVRPQAEKTLARVKERVGLG